MMMASDAESGVLYGPVANGSISGPAVPNPPKKKVYLITYLPTVNKVDDEDAAQEELDLFYDLLESFQLIYLTQLTGDKCGGLQKLECPEEFRCEFESGGKYAEGICVPTESDATATSCPFISAPVDCYDYRISEYSKNGCPTRFQCVGEDTDTEGPAFRDLNIVDAGRKPEEIEVQDGAIDEEEEEEAAIIIPEVDDEVLVSSSSDEEEPAEESSDELSDYEIPEASDVSREYVNSQKSFTVLYPKNWYFASFGAIDGTLWKVGFADKALEDADEAIITLSLMEKDGGRASKKIGDIYYVVDGPIDLAEAMKAIADSIESF